MLNTIPEKPKLLPRKKSTVQEDINQLTHFETVPLTGTAFVKKYHALLLFYKAYPKNKIVDQLAQRGLNRITLHVQNKMLSSAKNYSTGLEGSGLLHTTIHCSFSFVLVNWLVKKFPGSVHLDASACDAAAIRAVFPILLPAIEFENFSTKFSSLKWPITHCSGIKKTNLQLEWLLNLIHKSETTLAIKENLFAQLKVFIRWDLEDLFFNRSALRLPAASVYYYVNKTPSSSKAGNFTNPTFIQKSLSFTEKVQVLDIMKASLALQYRETDPFTYGNPDAIQLLDAGMGLQIGIAGILPVKQLALESYFGFMAFKNGYPVAYGGGWMFGAQCTIGVNIYPEYRNGASAWLFTKILQAYHYMFRVTFFLVKPYQFGKNNSEGIKTGAFWFYYKLGFRPLENTIREKAKEEWLKIKAKSGYRTPVDTLHYFTKTALFFCLDAKTEVSVTAANISTAISNYINLNYNGKRDAAIAKEENLLRKELKGFLSMPYSKIPKHSMENWSLLAGCIGPISEWSAVQKKSFCKWIEYKTNNKELFFIKALQKKDAFQPQWIKKIMEYCR